MKIRQFLLATAAIIDTEKFVSDFSDHIVTLEDHCTQKLQSSCDGCSRRVQIIVYRAVKRGNKLDKISQALADFFQTLNVDVHIFYHNILLKSFFLHQISSEVTA